MDLKKYVVGGNMEFGETDSTYEIEFIKWLKYAKKDGFVLFATNILKEIEVFPKITFNVKNQRKGYKTYTLIKQINYTPDFYVELSNSFFKTFKRTKEMLKIIDNNIFIDVKAKTNRGKSNTSNVSFPIKRAAIYQKYGVLVVKARLDGKNNWYNYTYVPKMLALSKSKKFIKKKFKGKLLR